MNAVKAVYSLVDVVAEGIVGVLWPAADPPGPIGTPEHPHPQARPAAKSATRLLRAIAIRWVIKICDGTRRAPHPPCLTRTLPYGSIEADSRRSRTVTRSRRRPSPPSSDAGQRPDLGSGAYRSEILVGIVPARTSGETGPASLEQPDGVPGNSRRYTPSRISACVRQVQLSSRPGSSYAAR